MEATVRWLWRPAACRPLRLLSQPMTADLEPEPSQHNTSKTDDEPQPPNGPDEGLREPHRQLAPDEEWPYGRLADNASKEARLVQGIVGRINRYADQRGETPYAISRSANIGYETLYKLLRGETFPNLVTIASLERHFNRRLWGNEHLPRGSKTPPTPPNGCEL